jgi:hypothetical protein
MLANMMRGPLLKKKVPMPGDEEPSISELASILIEDEEEEKKPEKSRKGKAPKKEEEGLRQSNRYDSIVLDDFEDTEMDQIDSKKKIVPRIVEQYTSASKLPRTPPTSLPVEPPKFNFQN